MRSDEKNFHTLGMCLTLTLLSLLLGIGCDLAKVDQSSNVAEELPKSSLEQVQDLSASRTFFGKVVVRSLNGSEEAVITVAIDEQEMLEGPRATNVEDQIDRLFVLYTSDQPAEPVEMEIAQANIEFRPGRLRISSPNLSAPLLLKVKDGDTPADEEAEGAIREQGLTFSGYGLAQHRTEEARVFSLSESKDARIYDPFLRNCAGEEGALIKLRPFDLPQAFSQIDPDTCGACGSGGPGSTGCSSGCGDGCSVVCGTGYHACCGCGGCRCCQD